jgi:acyl carrier protein
MTRADVERAIVDSLTSVAPEIDGASLKADVPLRDQTDLDSMDFLRFVVELHRRLAVDVPEADYAKLTSIAAAADYLASRLPGAPS